MMKHYCQIIAIALLFKVSTGHDKPCAVRQTQFGAVCVCNSSYCDTVERPPPITRGRYYRYTTSSDSPGFTRTNGTFKRKLSDVENQIVAFIINSEIKHQEILGFGGSFTDSAGIVLDDLPKATQEKFIESYFSVKGLEYNMGRLPIGATDFSMRLYTYDDHPYDKNLKFFSLAEEDYKYKIPFIQKVLKASPHDFKMIASSFSSPKWMKTNDSWLVTYVREKYFDSWAKYHIKFLDAYDAEGIKMWTLTGGNEVQLGLDCSCLILGTGSYPHDQVRWFREHLVPSLAASNHSHVKLLALDDARFFAIPWMSRFARDPESYQLVEGIALHWYFDWYIPDNLLWLLVDIFHMEYPDKLSLLTESSVNVLFGGEPVELGSWTRGTYYIYSIIQNINHWSNDFIDWNLALDTNGGPNLNLPTDAAIITNSSSGEFYKNPIFYALGHFSKFIPPGSRRVDVQSYQTETPESDIRPEVMYDLFKQSDSLADFLSQLNYSMPDINPLFSRTRSEPPKFTIPKGVFCTATVSPDNSSTIILFNSLDTDVYVVILDTTSGYLVTNLTANSLNTFVYWPNND